MNKTKIESIDAEGLRDLLELMTAYQRSRVLFSFVELKIADLLAAEPLSADRIAREKKIDPLAAERFLHAAAALGLLKKEKDLFANTRMTSDFLVGKTDFFLGGQIERQRRRSWKVWGSLTKKLKSWKYGQAPKDNPESTDQGAEAMTEQHNLALLHGYALGAAFDFSKYRRLLDLGGGTGASSIGLCRSWPELSSVVFELPENIEVAGDHIACSGLEDRIEARAGDFKKDGLPEGFDAVLLANFMSVADAAENKKLLAEIYGKLPAGGVCILSGWIIDDSHLAPTIPVLFCLEDICWDAPDVERDERIYAAWLEEAGFTGIRCETYLEPTKMLYGFKR